MYLWTKHQLYRLLRWSERYTKADMVYFASGNFWLVGGRFLTIGIGMLLTIAFANLLAPEVYGTYKYVIAIAGVIGAFSLNGMGASIQRAIAQHKKNAVPGATRASILWSLPASLVALAIATYYFVHHNETLGFGLLFIAITAPFTNGFGNAKSVLLGSTDFKGLTLSNLPRTLFPVLVMIGTLLTTQNLVYILLAYFGSNALAAFVLYHWTLKRHHIQDEPQGVSEVVRFGYHMSVVGFFLLISGQIDQLLLFHFAGPAQLAIYSLALTPVQEANNFLGNIFSIAFPKLAARSKAEAQSSVSFRLKQLILLSIAIAILYVLAVPFLFKYLFPKYLPSVLVSQVLALMILLQPKGIIDIFITAHAEIKERYKVAFASQAVEFLLYCTLIPLFGLWGAVAATILAEVGSAISFYAIYRLSV